MRVSSLFVFFVFSTSTVLFPKRTPVFIQTSNPCLVFSFSISEVISGKRNETAAASLLLYIFFFIIILFSHDFIVNVFFFQ